MPSRERISSSTRASAALKMTVKRFGVTGSIPISLPHRWQKKFQNLLRERKNPGIWRDGPGKQHSKNLKNSGGVRRPRKQHSEFPENLRGVRLQPGRAVFSYV